MLGHSFEQCISIAFMAEEEQDYSLALSYLIKASQLATSHTEISQCHKAMDICLSALEHNPICREDILLLRRKHLNSNHLVI